MSDNSGIEWTKSTWNPTTGCSKVSQGCKKCYAEVMSLRLNAMGQKKYKNGFRLTLHEKDLEIPLRWKRPRIIFVNSMSDLFHPDVPLDFIQKVFDVMKKCPQHRVQVLTKRADRLEQLAPKLSWPKNVWMGVSIENQDTTKRINNLLKVPAAVRFLSIEPLIGKISRIKLTGIDWVIVGGESEPGCRPMEANWATYLRDRCIKQKIPFFFKQWGGVHKKKNGRTLDGRTWDEMPVPKKRRK